MGFIVLKPEESVGMQETIKTDDASGRGSVEGYRVPFPGRMHGYSEEGIAAVVDVMKNADGQTQGQKLRRFEADFKAYTCAPHAFGVDNATNALRLAAALCSLGRGDEVIIPAYTFCATAIPFGATGARIVWADIDPQTWVVDVGDIERKITRRTKAIVAVHLLGMPVDMPRLLRLAERHGLRVVEDCAQSPGASIGGRKVGTFGDFGCFSLHGAKNITTLGEGGVLTVRSAEDAALVSGLRHNGIRAFSADRPRYWVPAMSNVDLDLEGVWPFNFCVGEAQCALGSAELKTLDRVNATLIEQAEKIKRGLSDTPEIQFARVPEGCHHIFHQFVMHFDGKRLGATRDNLVDILVNEHRIRAIVQYYPLYRYPLFRKMGFGDAQCPVLEGWWDDSFSFPWWCGIPDDAIAYLVDSAKKAIASLGKARR